MKLYPAIDILGGEVVTLRMGDFEDTTVYSDEPATMATEFLAHGARNIHVIDLNRAKHDGENDDKISAIADIRGLELQVGGGVSSMEDLEKFLSLGANRVVIGTAIITDKDFVKEACKKYPDNLVAAIDMRDGKAMVKAMKEKSDVDAYDMLKRAKDYGFKHAIFTDANHNDTTDGIDIDAFKKAAEVFGAPIIAAGGLKDFEELQDLSELGDDVLEGVIISRVLYDKHYMIQEALQIVEGERE